jgi:hypothetical protein
MSTSTSSSKQYQERSFRLSHGSHARSFTRLAPSRSHALSHGSHRVARTLFHTARTESLARSFTPNPSKTDVRTPNIYRMNVRGRIEFSETPILRTMVNTADARLFFYCTDTQSYTIIMLSSSGGHYVNHHLVMSTCTSLFKHAQSPLPLTRLMRCSSSTE